MQLHQLRPVHPKKNRKRVGRGGKKGTYSGRGIKGQKARSGKKPRPGFAGGDTTLIKRLPKKRGVVGKIGLRKGVKLSRFKLKPVALNLKDIQDKFKSGEVVSPESLLKKGLIDKIKGRIPSVKILSMGELKKELKFKNVLFSQGAQAKITAKKEKKKTSASLTQSNLKPKKKVKTKNKTKKTNISSKKKTAKKQTNKKS